MEPVPASLADLADGLDYPMVVITVAHDGERAGCLVGFSTQCSIDPERYAVFVSDKNHTAAVASRAETMVVHFLRRGDGALARLFGEETGDEVAKFDQCAWHPAPDGTPVLDGCDWVAGRVLRRSPVGDHVFYLLEVTEVHAPFRGADQLGFQAVRGMDAGHAP